MFISLKSGTRFGAHQEMCEIIEALEDSVLDFSFRGRDNYFVMENSDKIRYILYVFLVCPSDKGWTMKMLNENEHIPNVDCPLRLVRQSNLMDDNAHQWRSMVRDIHEQNAIERISITNEATPTCLCRSKNVIADPKAGEANSVHKRINKKEALPF